MSAPRHAQRHWLQLQARRAVDAAERVDTCSLQTTLAAFEQSLAETDRADVAELLTYLHGDAVAAAASMLVRAELVHRRICELGGEVPA